MSIRAVGLFTVICVLFFGLAANGQVTTAGMSGSVKDESGALLPGVSVVVKNLDTGLTRSVVTDDEGRYRAPELTLGSYEVKAELSGFQTGVRTGIKLTVGREASVDITLKVGAITERVVVSGEAPLVETASATITGLVDDKKIRDLPLNGRSFTQLAALQEGVASPANYESAQPGNEGQKISIGGTRITQTAFLLDGTDIRNHYGTTPGSVAGVLLGVDTVREFSVVTSAASAEYGGFTGGVVNAVTRSGTNELHGSLFEFLRNSSLDARNFFDAGANPPPFRRNQFGLTLGGPIRKDKTFFFASYEALRDRLSTSATITVPDANAHLGILPASRGGNVGVNPRVKPYLDYYPLPNGRNFGDGTGEYLYLNRIPTNEHYVMGKVDHNFSDTDSFFVRYTLDNGKKSNLSALPIFEELRDNRSQFVTLEEKKIVSAKLINQFRFAFNRNLAVSSSNPLVAIDRSLQFLPVPDRTFGSISVTGITGWGPSALATLDQILNRFEYADNLIYTSGRHSLKVGFKFTRLQFNVRNGVFGDGAYAFSSLVNFLTATTLSVNAKLGYTNPPGGLPAPYRTGIVGPLPKVGLRESMVGIFVQDDFNWRPNFTWNLGLRYEMHTNPNEVGGRVANLDEPTGTQLRTGNPLLANNPSVRSFAPRVGFAWDLSGNGKMSVRAGAGLYYDFIGPERLLGIQQQPPFFSQVTPLAPPFPNFLDIITPQLISGNPSISVFKTPKQAYVTQYNLTLQRELAPLTVVTVGYQGTRGTKLSRFVDYNLAPVQVVDGRYFWPVTARRPNPNFSQIRMMVFDGNSFFNSLRAGLSRRFGQGFQFQVSYTYGRAVDEASNTASFDTGGATSNGISNSPFDHKLDRSLSNFDVRHVFSSNATLELPFGAGKPLGAGVTGLAGKLISGWQISGILTLTTGPPVNIRVGDNRSRSQANPDIQERPDLRPGASNNPVRGGPDQYFDPNAFVLQPAGFYGNVGRNTLIGPGIAEVDLSISKDTAIAGEGVRLQFRAEAFNLFNRANFFRPASTVFTGPTGIPLGNAGRITTTTTTARQIQFALKLVF